jgi:phenylacetate-CoA ligase
MEFVLAQHGIRLEFSADVVACLNVGAQLHTVTFANVFSVWNQAGFAKVNLHPSAWSREKARRFFQDQAPLFLTGDPLGFVEMIRWEIGIRPAAMLSTAVKLTPATRRRLESLYGCPVIDSYATTETGPIAYSNPEDDGMNLLTDDIYVEIVDGEGCPVPEGERGEICVTGGRNPYLPLLRYRTGDFARMVWSRAVLSDRTPRLLDLEGREAVSFTARDGTLISTVDVGRIIRNWPFVQHEFVQHADLSCDLTIQPIPGCAVDTGAMRDALSRLFGRDLHLAVRTVENLGAERPGGKVIPFVSEAGG